MHKVVETKKNAGAMVKLVLAVMRTVGGGDDNHGGSPLIHQSGKMVI